MHPEKCGIKNSLGLILHPLALVGINSQRIPALIEITVIYVKPCGCLIVSLSCCAIRLGVSRGSVKWRAIRSMKLTVMHSYLFVTFVTGMAFHPSHATRVGRHDESSPDGRR